MKILQILTNIYFDSFDNIYIFMDNLRNLDEYFYTIGKIVLTIQNMHLQKMDIVIFF